MLVWLGVRRGMGMGFGAPEAEGQVVDGEADDYDCEGDDLWRI